MNRLLKSMLNLKEIEELARKKNWGTRMNPLVKILWTVFYIVLVASVDKYNLSLMLLLMMYPVLAIISMDLPFRIIGSKLIIPVIVSIGVGILNPFLDRDLLVNIGGIHLSKGMISFFVIVLKSLINVLTSMLLVSTTTMDEIGRTLIQLKVPRVFVTIVLMTYRYIEVLGREVIRSTEAYQLRSGDQKGLHISVWGSFVGGIIVKSYKRAQDIYQAMKIRGYEVR